MARVSAIGSNARGLPGIRSLAAALTGDWRRFLWSRNTHAALGLVHLTLCVAVATVIGEIAGIGAALAMCVSAAAIALLTLSRVGEPMVGRESSYGRKGMVAGRTGAAHAGAASMESAPAARAAAHREITGLMALMSHELRTPLNAIIGFSEMIERRRPSDQGTGTAAALAVHIRDSGHAMLRVADETIALTAAVAAARFGTFRHVELDGLIDEAKAGSEAFAATRGISLTASGLHGVDVRIEPRAAADAIAALLRCACSRAAVGSGLTLQTTRHRGAIELALTVETDRPEAECLAAAQGSDFGAAALQLSVARTLLAIQDVHLHTATGLDGRWRAIIELPTAYTGAQMY